MDVIHKSTTNARLKDLWRTPRSLFDRLDFEFNFDTDVAASSENSLCGNFITKEMNALTRKYWGWSNFCNPPYSRLGGGKKAWIQKAIDQSREMRSTVMLLPADISTDWFMLSLQNANEIRFIVNGRIRFINPETMKSHSNFFSSVLIIFKGYPNTGQAVISFMERPK